jgi:putative tricarboxylic transport membrane protein
MILKIEMHKGEVIFAVAFFCMGIFAVIESLSMPLGQFNTPGPGIYPLILGALLLVVSLILGFTNISGRSNTDIVRVGHGNIWAVLITLILVAVLLERIGFILTVTTFLLFLLKKLSDMGWVRCIALAFGGAIGAFLFFDILLGQRLPPLPSLIRWDFF